MDEQNASVRDESILDQFIGQSEWMSSVRSQLRQLAGFNYNVLISGPSGTGKECIARSIHQLSPRFERPFIPVNCAAIPPGLFSSQLFGHEKGAFTGADYASMGCFRAAEGGTIFLDEIGELDLEGQAKLLRVLQERAVTPVGSHESLPIDVRTIAATNRDLVEEVKSGRFRLDLYYRLNVLAIRTKGLADRMEDIEPLANHFLAKTALECGMELKSLTYEALEVLRDYPWPGNVRELENFIERAVVLTQGDLIHPDAFPDILEHQATGTHSADRHTPEHQTEVDACPSAAVSETSHAGIPAPWPTLATIEREHLEKTLKETFYNQSAAARLLGIDRKLLGRKIKKHQIVIPLSKPPGSSR
ncbi:MAG: sigma-54 dependent transcriptional regulator [Planctomycetota bacterium]